MPMNPSPPRGQIVLGTMWPDLDTATAADLAERIAVSADLGVTTLDTAPLYGFGLSESLLGDALAPGGPLASRRDQLRVMTKVGLRWDDDFGDPLFTTMVDGREVTVRKNSRPESIRHEVEASLRRLRTDRIDRVQVHQLDPRTPVAATMDELQRLRDEGKVVEIGISNYPMHAVRAATSALGSGGVVSNQIGLSLLQQEQLEHLVRPQSELGIRTLAYSPLASGDITRPAREGFEATDDRSSAIGRATRDVLVPLAEELGATPAQVALAWVLHVPGVEGAVVGARSVDQARENATAARLDLSESQRATLATAFASVLPRHRRPGLLRRGVRKIRRLLRL